VILTSNLRHAGSPLNVLIPAKTAGLTKDSVAIVSQLVTLDRELLDDRLGKLPSRYMIAIDAGLKIMLDLV
jgi:mRNA interferase MazF